jgi:energy-coupling factor transport system ATP-binding protein
MAHIEIKNLTFSYPDSSKPAIKDLSLEIEQGQFVVLFGASGSGKSTLLRLLKKDIQPHGNLSGEILINGVDAQKMVHSSREIGFVFQDPENQVVAEDVLHELVFGLENIGLSTNEMRCRVAEMVHFFGAETLLNRKMHELSGGKKQQINLASVLLMQPNILLLDEPTAQLDPVSTRELLDMLKRLNEEFGMTIILVEHRLEEVFTLADQIVMMDNGQILLDGHPKERLSDVWKSVNNAYVPTIPKLFFKSKGKGSIPLSVKEGRRWIQQENQKFPNEVIESTPQIFDQVLIRAKKLWFRYDKKTDFILRDLDFTLFQNELYALLGGNGSGKSTFLKTIANLIKVEQGKIDFNGKPLKSYKMHELTRKVGYLPQNPKLFFIQDTVEKEIQNTMEKWGISNQNEIYHILRELGIEHLTKQHPYDLSGGEIQKAALACLLIRNPEILLLDEPTKGLDPVSKETLAKILLKLSREGKTILMSTHDVEFAAQYATRCGMMFQGSITSEGSSMDFFKGNFFYTTMLQRLYRDNRNPPANEEAFQLS